MSTPFGQTLNCYYGSKPFYEPGSTGAWQVSYDGDRLALQSLTGNLSFGGRFSTSSNPVARQNYPSAAYQQTYLGVTGGSIWFTKDLSGRVISSGHNAFGGNNARADVVECGAEFANKWTPRPASTPFHGSIGQSLNWHTSGSIQMNCSTGNGGSFGTPIQATVRLANNGSLAVVQNSNNATLVSLSGAERSERNEFFPFVTRHGGGRALWYSIASNGERVSVNTDLDFFLLAIGQVFPNGNEAKCVPIPLDPRA